MPPTSHRTPSGARFTLQAIAPQAQVAGTESGYRVCFDAMASSCEILLAGRQTRRGCGSTPSGALAASVSNPVLLRLAQAVDEVKRIEAKYSRFCADSVLSQLNRRAGQRQSIDDETLGVLRFAEQCYRLSQGRFDITAGPLIGLWRFNESAAQVEVPSVSSLKQARAQVGFERLALTGNSLLLPPAMSLDLGGIAKEYAADRVLEQLSIGLADWDLLVNLGGDMVSSPAPKRPWSIGVEDPSRLDHAALSVSLNGGAVATSGHSRRYFVQDGVRYGHIIDPVSGYPVMKAPLSVTVFAPQCVVAGMLATMAMLQGEDAEAFLAAQGVNYHIIFDLSQPADQA